MPWTDPKSPWRRQQRRRLVMSIAPAVAAQAALVGAAVAIAVLLGEDARRGMLEFLSGGTLALVIVCSAIWTLLPLQAAVQEGRVLRSVPKHEGALCVRCRRGLPAAAREDPEAPVTCSGCGTSQSLAQAHEAWEAYPWLPGRPGRASIKEPDADERRIGPESGGLAGLGDPADPADPAEAGEGDTPGFTTGTNRQLLIAAVGVSTAVVAYFTIVALITGDSLLARLGEDLPMAVMAGGAILIAGGVTARRGSARHCAQCNYPVTPDGEAEKCPECGNDWRRRGRYVEGRRDRRPGVIVAGAILAILGGTVMFTGGGSRFDAMMPTSSLVKRIISGSGWDHENWPALNARTLTAEEASILLDGLLRQLEADDYVATDGHVWIQARLQSGEASPEHAARYVGDAMTVTSVEPVRMTAGDPLPLTLHIARPPELDLSTAGTWGLLIGDAVLVGPDGEPVGSTVVSDGLLRNEWSLAKGAAGGAAKATGPFRVVIDGPKPQAPGPHRVRVEVWRAILPFAASDVPITRDETGAIVMPPNVRWTERMVVEHAVEVAEADGG